jgi:hypothetical protein
MSKKTKNETKPTLSDVLLRFREDDEDSQDAVIKFRCVKQPPYQDFDYGDQFFDEQGLEDAANGMFDIDRCSVGRLKVVIWETLQGHDRLHVQIVSPSEFDDIKETYDFDMNFYDRNDAVQMALAWFQLEVLKD